MINEVWVVDDDAIFKRILNFLFKQNKLYKNVVEFDQGLAAKKTLEQRLEEGVALPNVILIDTNMPIMSGIDFLTWFSKYVAPLDNLTLPSIYLMSSSAISPKTRDCPPFSILSGFLEKPLKEEHLIFIATEELSPQK